MEIVDATAQEGTFDIKDAPLIPPEHAQIAADMVEQLREKYGITEEDMNALFNGMVMVFVRGEYCKQLGYVPSGEDQS